MLPSHKDSALSSGYKSLYITHSIYIFLSLIVNTLMALSTVHDPPLVTICIVTFNRGWVVGEALKSLLMQNYPKNKLYVVVVDGGSTDDTVKVCHRVLSGAGLAGYEVIVQPSSIPVARNIGISRVKGEFLFFWDSDIIMEPLALEKLVRVALEANVDIISAEVHFLSVKNLKDGWRALDGLQNRHFGDPVPVPAVTMSATMIKLGVLERMRFDPDLTLYEDLDFCIRAREAGFHVMVHHGVVAIDLNLALEPGSDIFTTKPISELLRGLRKKARAKFLALGFQPSLLDFVRYLLAHKRYAYYLGYMPMFLLLVYALVLGNWLVAAVPVTYITTYGILQVFRRGIRRGLKVLVASFVVGLPMALLMLYYSFIPSKFVVKWQRSRGRNKPPAP